MVRRPSIAPTGASRRLSRQRGAALLLAFLAIVILTVVVAQLRMSSSVDYSVARNQLDDMRFRFSARAALEQARAMLITDLRDEKLDEEANSAGGGGDESGTGGSSSMGENGAGGAGGEGGEEQDPPNDTIKDNWADAGQGQQQYGEIEAKIRIVDEDRKFNLLSIVARDEEFAKLSRERAIRLFDTFREGSDYDLSVGESTDLVDGFAKWFRGDRDNRYPQPTPIIQKADTSSRFNEKEDTRFKEEEAEPLVYPLSMEELLAVEGMDETILYGIRDQDRYVPGLEDVVSIYSNVVFDTVAYQQIVGQDEEDPALAGSGTGAGAGAGSGKSSGGKGDSKSGGFDSPFGGGESGGGGAGGGGGGGGGNSDEKGSGAGEDPETANGPPTDAAGQLEATETNQGKININTVPLAVLRTLVAEEDIPYAVLEKIDEFRRTAVDEELLEQAKRRGYGKEDGSKSKDKSDKGKENNQGLGQDEQDLESMKDDFTFHDPNEVIEKVQDFFDTNFEIGEQASADFANALAVKSNVFTVYIELRNREKSGRSSAFDSRSESTPDAVYQAVVWRRKEGDKFQAITIVPLHPWQGALPFSSEEYRRQFPFGF